MAGTQSRGFFGKCVFSVVAVYVLLFAVFGTFYFSVFGGASGTDGGLVPLGRNESQNPSEFHESKGEQSHADGNDTPVVAPDKAETHEEPDLAAQIALYNLDCKMLDGGFVYFNQKWDAFKNKPYGSKTVGEYGCGPVNIAMVISSIKNKYISPLELTALAEEWGCFVEGAGTAHTIFKYAAEHYGVTMENFVGSKKEILRRLGEGEYIICSMVGIFSPYGHFVTLRGITDDGKILIADSNSETRTADVWEIDYLVKQLKYSSMWAYSE